MASIAEQIIAARKAKGMTQDALAMALSVSRTTISNYEAGRRLPDAETLLMLSRVLEHSFEGGAPRPQAEADPGLVAAADPPAATPSPDAPEADPDLIAAVADPPAATPSPAAAEADLPERPARKAPRKARRLWTIGAAALAVLCAAILAPRALNRGRDPEQYTAEDGAVFTVEQFQRETPRRDGSAWLLGEKGVKVVSADGNDVWMYDFTFHEMNGVGLEIDGLEVCIFYGDKVLPTVISGESLPLYGLEQSIPPRGEWTETGGLPVSGNVKGVGITLNCTDANGESTSFSNYMTLNIT